MVLGGSVTTNTALAMLAPRGRAVVVGLSREKVAVDTHRHILGLELELIGANDHLLSEIAQLFEFVERGQLRLDSVLAKSVPLKADAINGVLDALDAGTAPIRSIVEP